MLWILGTLLIVSVYSGTPDCGWTSPNGVFYDISKLNSPTNY
jgi:hypothetical protein